MNLEEELRVASGDHTPVSTPPIALWIGLSVLLLGEALALGVRFEGVDASFGGHRWWSELLARAHAFFDVLVLSAGAALLFGAADLADEFQTVSRKRVARSRFWPFLLAHFAIFGVFAWFTSIVWEGGIERGATPGMWVGGWASLGLATLISLMITALPFGFWWPMISRCRGAIAIGLVVGVVSWLTGQYTQILWKPLHRGTFQAVNALLSTLVPDVISSPSESILGVRNFSVTIHPSCSGYEGIGLILVFVGAYLWHYRGELRFPRSLVLLPLGTVLIWLTNVVRIVALVLIGAHVSPAIALGGFHSQGGWIAFLGVSLGLFVAARQLPFFRVKSTDTDAAEDSGPNPTTPFLAPLFALLATMMVTAALSAGFDRFYPVRVLVTSAVLWHFRRVFLGWRRDWSGEAITVGAVVFVIWMALEPTTPSTSIPSPLFDALMSRPVWWSSVWLLFRVFGSVITVPVVEEIAFRGFLMRRLIASDFEKVPPGQFSWFSFLASSFLFGLLHGRLVAGVVAGMLYALVVYRRRNLFAAVLAHATTNALIAVAVLFADRWSLWE